MGRGKALYSPSCVFFLPILKRSKSNPYLKMLDFSELFCGCPYEEKKLNKLSFTEKGTRIEYPYNFGFPLGISDFFYDMVRI